MLAGLLARAAEGFSGALVLRGEPGVGKTTLLDDTAAAAMTGGMRISRLTGVLAGSLGERPFGVVPRADRMGELGAGDHAQLAEHLSQVVLDGA